MQCEIAGQANFATIRYAQCWEDADILLEALDIQPGQLCLSIASAGDNTLALLSRAPGRVIALDLNPAQLACLELRVATYRVLSHPEMLELLGSTPSQQRMVLYARCKPLLSSEVRAFWDARPDLIQQGIASAGKFERYLSLFRRCILPLIHPRARLEELFECRSAHERTQWYDHCWNTRRWNWLLRLFCSRLVMGHLGRDPRFFAYAEQGVSTHLLPRIRHALTTLDPVENPYLQWIITGHHPTALPYALRPEHFETIRANLDRLEWRCQSLETFLGSYEGPPIERANLSNIFEYMSEPRYHSLLQHLAALSAPSARLAYWNMLVPRVHSGLHCRMAAGERFVQPLKALAHHLHQQDRAFFYRRFCIEEIQV